MSATTISILMLIPVVMAIIALNDVSKRRAADRLRAKGKRVPPHLADSRTNWKLLWGGALAMALYAVALNFRETFDRDFGPLTPLVRWMFQLPPE